MVDQFAKIEYGCYYHIFNHAISDEDLFISKDNYEYFLGLYAKYIEPVAETFAWALLKNHFHVLIKILPEEEIGFLPDIDKKTGKKYQIPKKYNPEKQFSHLFDAYAKAYNKRFKRRGGLFLTPFRRIKVDSERYFKKLIWYIHNNPVKHGFAKSAIEYPWTSYLSLISIKPTKLSRDKVIGWFDSQANFVTFHQSNHDLDDIQPYIIE